MCEIEWRNTRRLPDRDFNTEAQSPSHSACRLCYVFGIEINSSKGGNVHGAKWQLLVVLLEGVLL